MPSLTGDRCLGGDAERMHRRLQPAKPCGFLSASFVLLFLIILTENLVSVEGYSVFHGRPRQFSSLQVGTGTTSPLEFALVRRRRGLPLRAIETEIPTELARISTTLPKRSVGIDDDPDSEGSNNNRLGPIITVRPGPGVQVTRTSGNVVVATNDEGTEEDDDGSKDDSDAAEGRASGETEGEGVEQSSPEGDAAGLNERSAAVAAALLRRNAMKQRSAKSGTKVGRTQTSVGNIRSRGARKAGGVAGKVLGAVRTAASVAAAARGKADKAGGVRSDAGSDTNSTSASTESTSTPESIPSRSRGLPANTVIQSTVNDLIKKQDQSRAASSSSTSGGDEPPISASHIYDSPVSMGLLGERAFGPSSLSHTLKWRPYPGTTLLHPAAVASSGDSSIKDKISVRVATPSDDYNIANLRLSVFSDFTPDIRRKFCSRSCEVLSNRRMQGAMCLVASVDRSLRECIIRRNVYDDGADFGCSIEDNEFEINGEKEWFMGSVECSVHEFQGTELGRRRPAGAVLYITEVAVSPEARRCGAGTRLLKGVDELAAIREVETLYLHVDVTNDAACTLYEKAGYEIVDKTDRIYEEFTSKLNLHDGATKGRNHHLLQKHLTNNPTWIDVRDVPEAKNLEEVSAERQARSVTREKAGVLGFEV